MPETLLKFPLFIDTAAKAAGVSVENTNPKIRATEVTFLNVSENEIFIR